MIFWHIPPFLGKAASCVLSSFHAAAYCLQEQWQKKSIFLPQTRSGCCMCAFQLPCCCIPSSGAVVSNSPPSGQYRTCALFQSMPFITRPVPDTVSPQAFKLSVLGAFWFFISSAQHIHTHTHTHTHTYTHTHTHIHTHTHTHTPALWQKPSRQGHSATPPSTHAHVTTTPLGSK